MTETDDRRAHGSQRVKVKTLVEICGNQPGVPAFEARSLDVSGRGMHVTTAYVPSVGDPLVCRFESQGREIVVEGVVAWRRESEEGGDFGIEFTALDSGSVDALRSLCGVPSEVSVSVGEQPTGAQAPICAAGAQVKLHIDGLGSPMKANVRDGSTRRVHVGSHLEFLKVGRHLEIEDLGQGARRSAHIDKVDITVDPRSQIPELVVTLRYEGVDEATPEPSVVDSAAAAEELRGAPHDPTPLGGEVSSAHSEEDGLARQTEEEMLSEQERREQADAVYARIADAAGGAGVAAKAVGHKLAQAGWSATRGVGALFRGAGRQISEMQRERAEKRPRRQTAPPVSSTLSARAGQLRVQNPSARGVRPTESGRATGAQPGTETPTVQKRRRRLAVVAGALVVVGATTAFALRSVNDPKGAQSPVAIADAPAAAKATARKPAATKAPVKPLKAKKKQDSGEIVANVPLFGPTPMATLEPAPLGAAPEKDEEAEEKAAAAASVEDATWSSEANPKDVKPWGRGRMHLPTIHKLRLDGPGGALKGSVNATGFTVVVPGRKVLESGRAIQRRDKRIVQVRTSNQAAGAQISFHFKDGVPAYRVRLREDTVEFLISAPDA